MKSFIEELYYGNIDPQDSGFEDDESVQRTLRTISVFQHFLARGKKSAQPEPFFLALAFNLKKLWMKRDEGSLQTHLSEIPTV